MASSSSSTKETEFTKEDARRARIPRNWKIEGKRGGRNWTLVTWVATVPGKNANLLKDYSRGSCGGYFVKKVFTILKSASYGGVEYVCCTNGPCKPKASGSASCSSGSSSQSVTVTDDEDSASQFWYKLTSTTKIERGRPK